MNKTWYVHQSSIEISIWIFQLDIFVFTSKYDLFFSPVSFSSKDETIPDSNLLDEATLIVTDIINKAQENLNKEHEQNKVFFTILSQNFLESIF